MIDPHYQWQTQDGRTLDIRWMDSLHLVHSFNMLCRKHSLSRESVMKLAGSTNNRMITNMVQELKSRRLMVWDDLHESQLEKTGVQRESFVTLCMLRALLDTGLSGEVKNLRRHPEHYIGQIHERVKAGEPTWAKVITKFTEYRLAPPVNGG